MFIKDTFVHTVYFWLKNPDDLSAFIEGVKGLAEISYLRDVHVGIPAMTKGAKVDSTYHVSLLTFFNSEADHDAYQIDPIHENFLKTYAGPLCERVLVTDSIDA